MSISPCRYQFDFPGEAEALVETIRMHLSRAGGSLSGSASEGVFHLPTVIGNFRGTYAVSGQTCYLEVHSKPFFVRCRAIETKLDEYIRGSASSRA
jgi:hypothetical protein